MTHRFHEDIHSCGLDVDCEGCQELIKDPFGRLDPDLFQRIYVGEWYSEGDRLAGERMAEELSKARSLLSRVGEK